MSLNRLSAGVLVIHVVYEVIFPQIHTGERHLKFLIPLNMIKFFFCVKSLNSLNKKHF